MYESKCQVLINRRQEINLKHFKDSNAFTKYPNDMKDVYKSNEECNPGKKKK